MIQERRALAAMYEAASGPGDRYCLVWGGNLPHVNPHIPSFHEWRRLKRIAERERAAWDDIINKTAKLLIERCGPLRHK